MRKLHNVSYRVIMNVWKTIVIAKVAYGAEIWGYDDDAELCDRLVNNFMKTIVGVPKHTANSGVRLLDLEVSIQKYI